MSLRNLTRASATAVLAAGALALSATPALAADVDFGLNLTGTTIAADATGKLGMVAVTNHGTTTPKAVNVIFDASKVDDSKIEIYIDDECQFDENDIAVCGIDSEFIPGPGKTTELAVPLTRQDGASGAAGKLTIKVEVEGDSNKANDSKTVNVNVGGNGVDLGVYAPDVTGVDQQTGEPNDKDVKPGEVAVVWAYVWNRGDRIADGLRVEVQLPKNVVFADKEQGCKYAGDNRSVRCDYKDFSLLPEDVTGGPSEESSTGFFFPVQVSADAKGPVALKGGEVTINALEQSAVQAGNKKSKRKSVRPANARPLTSAQAAKDVDATDNTDPFAVLVAGGTSTGGSGAGDGDDDPSLPVTGPVAATVGGVGVAALVLGAFLFVTARRRRVVLVAPGDEK
ncbi:cell wall anchor protein [Jidongwangia harbinensis]|uniref:cell wall anchor protein n=1 Tax=Jidongwangia harbinensis TaxID=2878561 RepID=UPI001CD9B8E6|nr:cell wall anchor protein [Jidongwangia harbinensis]MCA2214609.1 cell wall anchor protein [Jidongwangia harbinensis]